MYIPKVVDGRNRIFWLLSLEGLRERNPQTQLWTVPTAEQRMGDFSGLVDNQRRPIGIYDPLTVAPNPAGGTAQEQFGPHDNHHQPT